MALTLAAAIPVAVPASSVWARRAADADRERLTAVATEVAVLLSSLSTDDAEASLDRLTALSTGRFRDEVTGRRAEVLRLVDDDEVRSSARVVASGVEQDVAVRGILDGGLFDSGDDPARARLLVAVRSEVSNTRTEAAQAGSEARGDAGADDVDGAGEGPGGRLWRWRIEAVIEDGRAVVASTEVAL
ncbi:hypothetical protein [Dietzia sp. B32]|uniref:hypothetical protein n=1 Tax=Dietzia sp. B32 TaxID=2915130 RepID=UPI0021ADAFB9|nr:hypothetical protein [Dietzia sp. B32]UVE96243.1 hypothetical protein L8M95_05555 [Dietzia sp. B32]